jgi:hypothetical protein
MFIQFLTAYLSAKTSSTAAVATIRDSPPILTFLIHEDLRKQSDPAERNRDISVIFLPSIESFTDIGTDGRFCGTTAMYPWFWPPIAHRESTCMRDCVSRDF